MSESAGKAVFLSYASQDAEAAKRICEALRAAGAEVWFDQSELRGGDAWDRKIRKQIAECALFLPIISANTEARAEGYFRIEWRLADRRTEAIGKWKAFLLPICIDDTRDAEADVPDSFLAVQWTRLPGGETSEKFCARVKALLAGQVAPASSRPAENVGRMPALPPMGRRVPAPAWIAGAAMVALGICAVLWLQRDKPNAGAGTLPPANRQSGAPSPETPNQREARALVARAWVEMNRTELYRAELEIADDLCRRATVLDPDCAEAWAAWSHVDCWYLYLLNDWSDARRESARTKSARAVKLDPKSFEARFAEANYLVRGTAGSSSGAAPDQVESVIARLRELLAERANEPRVWFALGILLRNAGKVAESVEAFDRMAAAPTFAATAKSEKGWMFWQRREFAAAVRACDESIALQPFRGNLLLQIYIAIGWLGDFDLARSALDRMPPPLRLEDDFVSIGARVYWWRREPAEMRRLLASVPRSWISWNSIPKAYLLGEAYRMAGDEEAARASWVEALRETDAQVAKSPITRLNLRRARLLALNGRKDEARQLLRLARAAGLPTESSVSTEFRDWAIALSNGDVDEALDALEKGYEANDSWAATWSMLRYNPLLDPLREHPRFQALLARAEADPGRNPHAKAKSAALAVPDSKSIAVLAFENRSNEKDGDVFSDGVSEELLNVLSRVKGLRVPARTSAFSFKGKGATAQEIGQKLGVAYLVEGTVRKSGDRVRITAKLINAADGLTLWISDALERESKDVWAVQDEIAGLIAEKLQLQLGAAPRAAKPLNPAAHQLLLEGRLFWLRRTFEDFDRADAAFGSALKLDPEFAQAQAGLADVAVMRATYRMLDGETDVADDIARARVAAQRALTLDGSLVEPHAALAYALMLEGKFAASEVEYQKALTLNPNYSTAYVWRGVLKFCEGRLDAAIDEFRKAVDLDPLWPINLHMLSEALTHAGRFGEALAVNARGSAIRAVDWPPERGVLAMAAWRHGRRDDALSAARLVRQLWPQPPRWFADVDAIWILGQAGLRDEANAHAMQLLKELPAANSHRGLVLAALGRFDEALPHLERSGVMTRRNLFWDPVFDRFRDDPRFPQLMVKLGCAVEYKTARETLQRMQAKP